MSARASALAVPPAAVPSASRPSATQERQRASEPWTPTAITRLAAATGAGLLMLGVAWYGASATIELNRQLLFLVVGMAGVTTAAVSQGMFVLDGMRHLKQRRFDVMVDVYALTTGPEASAEGDERVASDLMTHFHRGDCPLVAGKDLALRGPAAEHLVAGRTACGVCAA